MVLASTPRKGYHSIMDTLSITINEKPPSTNSLYYTDRRTGTRHKSKEYRAFEKVVDKHISSLKFSFNKFDTAFSPFDHCLFVTMLIEIPESDFFTKDGKIRARKHDWDGFPKPFQDSIFKHFEKIDDAYVINGNVAKIPSPGHWKVTFTIFKENLDHIRDNMRQ